MVLPRRIRVPKRKRHIGVAIFSYPAAVNDALEGSP